MRIGRYGAIGLLLAGDAAGTTVLAQPPAPPAAPAPGGGAPAVRIPDLDVKTRGPVRQVDVAAFPPASHIEFVAGPTSGFDAAYLMLTRVPPGANGPPLHRHSSDQIYFVFKGEMSIQLGDETFKAGPNTLVFIPAGTPHRNWNAGGQDEVHFEMLVPPTPRTEPLLPAEPRRIKNAAALITRAADVPNAGGAGRDVRWLARQATGSTHVAIHYDELQPGAGARGLHVSDADQVYFVTDGTLDLQLGLKTYRLKPNTYAIVPAGTVSRVWNGGGAVAKGLTLLFPAPGGGAATDVPVALTGKGAPAR